MPEQKAENAGRRQRVRRSPELLAQSALHFLAPGSLSLDKPQLRRSRAGRSQLRPHQSFVSDVQAAALSVGKQIEVLEAPTGRDSDTAFAIDALLVGPGPLLNNRRVQLVTLATYHRVPCDPSLACLGRSRRSDELRNKHHRRISPGRH